MGACRHRRAVPAPAVVAAALAALFVGLGGSVAWSQTSVAPIFCIQPLSPAEPGAEVPLCVKGFHGAARIEVVLLPAMSALAPAERAGLPPTVTVATGVANARGELTTSAKVPELPAASYGLRAAETSGCGADPCRQTTQDFSLPIRAALQAATAASVGSTLSIRAQGLAPSARVKVQLGPETLTPNPGGTNALGTIGTTVTVPELTLGLHQLRLFTGASCAADGVRCASAEVTVSASSTTTSRPTSSSSPASTSSPTSSPGSTSPQTTAGSGGGGSDATVPIVVALIGAASVLAAALVGRSRAREP